MVRRRVNPAKVAKVAKPVAKKVEAKPDAKPAAKKVATKPEATPEAQPAPEPLPTTTDARLTETHPLDTPAAPAPLHRADDLATISEYVERVQQAWEEVLALGVPFAPEAREKVQSAITDLEAYLAGHPG